MVTISYEIEDEDGIFVCARCKCRLSGEYRFCSPCRDMIHLKIISSDKPYRIMTEQKDYDLTQLRKTDPVAYYETLPDLK